MNEQKTQQLLRKIGYPNGQQAYDEVLDVISHRENANENFPEIHT